MFTLPEIKASVRRYSHVFMHMILSHNFVSQNIIYQYGSMKLILFKFGSKKKNIFNFQKTNFHIHLCKRVPSTLPNIAMLCLVIMNAPQCALPISPSDSASH